MSNETAPHTAPHEPEAAVTPTPKRPWAKPTITIMGGPMMARGGSVHQEGGNEGDDPYVDMTS